MVTRAEQYLRFAIEAVVLGLVVLTPWPFGSVEPIARLGICAAISLLLVLWALRFILSRKLHWQSSSVLIYLGGLILFAGLQVIPLPGSILGVLSPNAKEAYQFYLPHAPEQLPDEIALSHQSEKHTLSLSPNKSHTFLMELLVLFVLYSVVCSNVASRKSFHRLAWACTINGSLLSLLALLQYFSSSPEVVFWTYKTEGAVFGPFVCRNHFAFYVTPCIGLAAGLILATSRKGLGLLQQPKLLWLISAVGLMVTAIFFSLSRGAVVSLITATCFGGMVWLSQKRRQGGNSIGPLVWIAGIVIVLASWFGFTPVESRLETLQDNPASEGRSDLWFDSLRLVPRYWLFGTGNGTFEEVEPSVRQTLRLENMVFDHAHNEYVEAVVEGGILRLGLTLALVGTIVWGGIRAFREQSGHSRGLLTLGGLCGFVAVAVQSFVDFGIHIPCVPLLMTVILAQCMATGSDISHRSPKRDLQPASITDRTSMIGSPVLSYTVAGLLVVLAVLITWQADRENRAAHYRNGALNEERASPPDRELAVIYLEAAVQCQPEKAQYHHELGQALLEASRHTSGETSEKLIRKALYHWREARNLSPLLPQPHVRLGLYRDSFLQADPKTAYGERAKRLAPTDPAIWYACGQWYFEAQEWDRAWSDWKESLQRSDRFLPEITKGALQQLSAEELLTRVLPDRPEVIHLAADALFPAGTPSKARELYLDRALECLQQRGNSRIASDYHLQGELLLERGRAEEGFVAFRKAVEQQPAQVAWRWEFAQALYQRELRVESRRELQAILGMQPNNKEARDLRDVIDRELKLLE